MSWYRKEYLQSEWWKERAARKRKSCNYKCNRCKGPGFDVHHKTYERMYAELDQDLDVLCRNCHQEEHFDKKKANDQFFKFCGRKLWD